MQPRFVVSTGRSGSTLMSELLARHPAVLSLSETFASLQPGAFPPGELDAGEFWAVISRPRPEFDWAMRAGFTSDELRYPFGAGRFTRAGGIPPLALVTLSSLGDADALHDELERMVAAHPPATAAEHYRRLFAELGGRLGRSLWVERSGGSLLFAHDLVRNFPDGRFVHLHRDGCATALSMSRHPSMRLRMTRELLRRRLGRDPFDEPVGDVPDELRPLLPGSFDFDAFMAYPLPLERFGRYWSATVLAGTRRLRGARVLHLSYDRLVADPERELHRLATFFALPEADWIPAAAALVEARPPALADLPEDELARLRRAVAPGEARLRALTGAPGGPQMTH